MNREELVEEIYDGMYGDFPRLAKESYLRGNVEWAISRISQAIENGELDEMLGVVGRWRPEDMRWHEDAVEYWTMKMWERGAKVLIALRPEGQEEEG